MTTEHTFHVLAQIVGWAMVIGSALFIIGVTIGKALQHGHAPDRASYMLDGQQISRAEYEALAKGADLRTPEQKAADQAAFNEGMGLR
jgi:hypothetical protein